MVVLHNLPWPLPLGAYKRATNTPLTAVATCSLHQSLKSSFAELVQNPAAITRTRRRYSNYGISPCIRMTIVRAQSRCSGFNSEHRAPRYLRFYCFLLIILFLHICKHRSLVLLSIATLLTVYGTTTRIITARRTAGVRRLKTT